MADTETHLREHAKYFDGLLELIPAKLYFSEDRSDQWQRKKQSKEQAKAAKRAKLDPANAKSVKDVLDERAGKRKRDDDQLKVEKKGESPAAKKQKKEDSAKKQPVAVDDKEGSTINKAKAKDSSLQKASDDKSQSRKQAKKAANQVKEQSKQKTEQRKKAVGEAKEKRQSLKSTIVSDTVEPGKEVEGQFEGLQSTIAEDTEDPPAATESVTSSRSPIFDAPAIQSGTSSISSFPEAPSATVEKPIKPQNEPKPSHDDLKLRLQKRLEELRAARKADKEDGAPARTRQELIEERRQKDEERKQRTKALRKQQKEDDRLKKEEEMARGSPLMSPCMRSPGHRNGFLSGSDPLNSFSFGKVAFDNGQIMSADLDRVIETQKKKGPKQLKHELDAAVQKEEKLAGMDTEKRAEIAEKDMWLNAKKRTHGEKVKDDTSLLKKALKRKDKQKKKSEKEWNARLEGVQKSQHARQHKREENIKKRKEEKGSKGSKKASKKKNKSKARPGFEGSFKAGVTGK